MEVPPHGAKGTRRGAGERKDRAEQSRAGEGLSGEFKQRASESGKSSQTERQERNKEQGKQKRASGGEAVTVMMLWGWSVSVCWGAQCVRLRSRPAIDPTLVLKGRKI